MTEGIIVALITGGVTLVGVLISNSKAQAVTDTITAKIGQADLLPHRRSGRGLPGVGGLLDAGGVRG